MCGLTNCSEGNTNASCIVPRATRIAELRGARCGRVAAVVLASGTLGGCRGVLDPKGRAASQTSRLAWLMFAIAAVVFLLVVGILVAGLLRRRGEAADDRPDGHDRPGGVMTVIGV